MSVEAMTVTGLKELDAQLAALANPETAYAIGLKAVQAPADLLKEAWVAAAPYSMRSSTMKYWSKADGSTGRADYGHLRDNITTGPVRSHHPQAVVWKTYTGNAFWGYFVEMGTVKMGPHPWARPAVERLKGVFVDLQIAALNEGIAQAVASKGAGGFGKVMANGRNG